MAQTHVLSVSRFIDQMGLFVARVHEPSERHVSPTTQVQMMNDVVSATTAKDGLLSTDSALLTSAMEAKRSGITIPDGLVEVIITRSNTSVRRQALRGLGQCVAFLACPRGVLQRGGQT